MCRFQQSFGSFTMYHIAESSKTGLVRHLSNHVFRSRYFRKYLSYEGHSFSKMLKIWSTFQKNLEKNWQKCFCFLDDCLWIGSVKFSLLRKEYLSSVVNMLTDSPKILHITKRNFFQLNFFAVIVDYNKAAVVQISAVFAEFPILLVAGSSETRLFRYLSRNVFRSPYFRKYIILRVIFFQNVQNLIDIPNMQKNFLFFR